MFLILFLAAINLGCVCLIIRLKKRLRTESPIPSQLETMAHDIRNALNNIAVFADIMSRRDGLQSREKEYITSIQISVERITWSLANLETGRGKTIPGPAGSPAPAPGREVRELDWQTIRLDCCAEYWQQNFREAVLDLDMEKSLELIADIPAEAEATGRLLTDLVKGFRFDILKQLTHREPAS